MATTLLWFRQDLRLTDNSALLSAASRGAVLPFYILDTTDPWAPGSASRWWLHHALQSLATQLQRLGGRLLLFRGDPKLIIPQLVKATQADGVMWNRCYEPHAIARDSAIKAALRQQGLKVETFAASLLFEPWEIQTQNETPYRVFTPYFKACLNLQRQHKPVPAPAKLTCHPYTGGEKLTDWHLVPTHPNWAKNFDWNPTQQGAQLALQTFLVQAVADYTTARDFPARTGTSRLSPYLHFGQISPREIWHATDQAMVETQPGLINGGESFLREIIWREFCHHLLYYQPEMPEQPLQEPFARFPWRSDAEALLCWQRGRTGYPIVDAGMRQLWQTGWMHNRVRMIVSSFLVKDLLLPWQDGAAWFWDTLVDADLANNAAGWQWVAGCGADAAPYFRIFNPWLQSRKFDPMGAYIRRFVPELAGLPSDLIHEPSAASPDDLLAAGVELGNTYPWPMLDHKAAKERALAALEQIKVAS